MEALLSSPIPIESLRSAVGFFRDALDTDARVNPDSATSERHMRAQAHLDNLAALVTYHADRETAAFGSTPAGPAPACDFCGLRHEGVCDPPFGSSVAQPTSALVADESHELAHVRAKLAEAESRIAGYARRGSALLLIGSVAESLAESHLAVGVVHGFLVSIRDAADEAMTETP